MSNSRSTSGARLKPASRGVLWATAAMTGAAGFWGSAHAQQLEEIVVTAERREMSLQDTPISIIAFTGDALEFKGVRDMFDLATLAPNLDIKGSRGSGNTSATYQIRGIGGGGGVGIYIDDVYMPRTNGPAMRVLDVERIEVLRGPQGTLFGRNSTGGAIRLFTKRPGPEREAYVRLTGGDFARRDVSAMINVPVNDRFYVRAQAALLEQDGFVTRGPQTLGDTEDTVLRLQAAWNPSDTVSTTLGLMYTDSESSGSPTDMINFNMAPACPFDDANPFICWEGNYADWMSDFLEQNGQERLRHEDPRLVLDDYTMPDFCFLDGPDPDWDDACLQWSKNDYLQLDANVTWDLSERVRMISTTGLSDFSSDTVSDWQLLGMEHRREQQESQVIYQELQFNIAMLDGALDFITGANYFHETFESPRGPLFTAYGSSAFGAFSPTGGEANGNQWGCAAADPFCAEPRLRRTGDSFNRTKTDSWGVFGSATWHATDRLNVTAGVRQIYDKRDVLSTVYASDNFVPQNGISDTLSGDNSWNETDWRATLDVRATDDIMLYLTASKAFRAGSFSSPGGQGPTAERPYNIRAPLAPVAPERLVNYELGFRSEWIDGRLRFNATVFEMDFTNRQGASAVPDATAPTGFTIQTVNQGDVDLSGIELDATFAVTDRFTLDASAGFVDYEMEDPCINNGLHLFPPPIDRSTTLGARYTVPMQNGANVSAGLSFARVGPQETHSGGLTAEQNAALGCPSSTPTWFLDSRYRLDGYGLLNGTVRYTSGSGRWSASLYGNNLTDENYANNAQSFGRGYWAAGGPPIGINSVMRSAVAEYRGRPRELGVTFQYDFF